MDAERAVERKRMGEFAKILFPRRKLPLFYSRKYKYVRVYNKEKWFLRKGFTDISADNRSLYKVKWSELHDHALMLGQQKFGICNSAAIKRHFPLFENINEDTINRRCHALLNCSSIKNINECGVKLCPYKISRYYAEVIRL